MEPQLEEFQVESENAISWYEVDLYQASVLQQPGQKLMPHLKFITAAYSPSVIYRLAVQGLAHDNGVNEDSIMFVAEKVTVEVFDDGGNHTDDLDDMVFKFVYEMGSAPVSQILAYGATYPVVPANGACEVHTSPGSLELDAPILLTPKLSVKVISEIYWIAESGDIVAVTGADTLAANDVGTATLNLGISWRIRSYEDIKTAVLNRVFERQAF